VNETILFNAAAYGNTILTRYQGHSAACCILWTDDDDIDWWLVVINLFSIRWRYYDDDILLHCCGRDYVTDCWWWCRREVFPLMTNGVVFWRPLAVADDADDDTVVDSVFRLPPIAAVPDGVFIDNYWYDGGVFFGMILLLPFVTVTTGIVVVLLFVWLVAWYYSAYSWPWRCRRRIHCNVVFMLCVLWRTVHYCLFGYSTVTAWLILVFIARDSPVTVVWRLNGRRNISWYCSTLRHGWRTQSILTLVYWRDILLICSRGRPGCAMIFYSSWLVRTRWWQTLFVVPFDVWLALPVAATTAAWPSSFCRRTGIVSTYVRQR